MKSEEINIYDLNYILFSSFRHKVKNPRPFWWCFAYFICECVKSVFTKHAFRYPHAKPVLVYAPSVNNKRTVKPILSELNTDDFTLWGSTDGDLPRALIFFYSLFHFKSFIDFYKSQTVQDQRLIRRFFETFFITIGRFIVIERFLRNNSQLKIILMSNDHNQTNRCFIELASKYGIKTMYCQHASITERFPSLHFDFAFLDGMESFDKYYAIGNIKGMVFLTGSPRYDELISYSGKIVDKDMIGVGLSEADNIEKAFELCTAIKRNTSNNVIVRPHPRTESTFPFETFVNNGIEVSYPSKETSLSFLSNIGFLVANESGIHLDAALMRKGSVLFNMSDNNIMDWYGFLKQGLIKQCDTIEEVLQAINNKKEPSSESARYYYAAWNTQFEGKVGLLISKFVKCVLYNANIDDLISTFFIKLEREVYLYI